MMRKLATVVMLGMILAITSCQLRTSEPNAPQAPVTLTTSGQYKTQWWQSSWADGPGHRAIDNHTGYWFAGGIQVQEDGSLIMSHIDTAFTTRNNDLNEDGYTDIIIANSGNYEFLESPFAQIRKSNTDHSMPDAKIYWGGPDGYNVERTTGVPGERPSSVAVIDFNLDGRLDLAVAGGGEFHPPYVNSRVYWGTEQGFSEQSYVSLPTSAATGTAAGDFNKDGYPDVVFANLGDYNFPFPPSLLYWGSPEGFSPDNRTELETQGVGGLAVADINDDGWLDIVFSNSAGFPPIDQLLDYGQDYDWPGSYIYFGSQSGFSEENRIALPTKGATGVKIADLNRDHYLDIVFANAGSFALPPLPDTYVYWGDSKGFSTERRTSLATSGASSVSISDLNRDGWLDLVLSVTGTYLYIGEPEFPNSFVYWGGADGFSDERRLALPTRGSQGNTITDVNGDGILDILFSQLGDFNEPYEPVQVFLGTGNTDAFYTVDKATTFPGQISYGSVVVGSPDGGDHMSHGNLAFPNYERPDAHVKQAVLISSAYFGQELPTWRSVSYDVDIPNGTKVILIMQTSLDGVEWVDSGQFELKTGSNNHDFASLGIEMAAQVRYALVLSSNGKDTPIIRSIRFN